ncbi:phytanoyl-CoA dioxygenase family protein [Sphingobium sp. JS3065]|jgi:ectoine hydroxylase-related dioxygenase (phytanoyl-CoA dioxygenase family)|uniref:phytanoyl-CoA dioxygenase family protein n=1 Tax=Sphingobium sp. JS3065 TaxID=2970925 RepID=UPI002265552B|nr:phytanoyl-CoA dioxygenase family protein [Sphingobium sp. JS3065]UZW57407.1 phytanoyl-CoA dioxygenase family protein [Sphingobium sp. JS3065]
MKISAVNLPDVRDLDARDCIPSKEFQDCTALLDDHDALNAFYDENGYLFFRNALSPESVARARAEMLAIAADHYGVIDKGDPIGRWNGKPLENFSEDGDEFAGISRRLIEDPSNQEFLAKVLGEPAAMVPLVQYRLYPPNGPITPVHQDGFYSPGIEGYRPVWTALVDCPREVGGLMVAVGQHKRGYYHNLAKPRQFPVAEGLIDPDSWATTDYKAGDVLVVHHCSPHAGTPNTSDRLRITLDTRVQSARNPKAFGAVVKAVTPTSLTVVAEDQKIGEVTLSVDENTYIRVLDSGRREDFSRFIEYTVPGMRILVVRDGNYAQMLRCPTAP